MRVYKIFEKVFGRFYHPVVRLLRFNNYFLSDVKVFLKINLFGKLPLSASSMPAGKRRIFYDVTFVSKGQRFAGISRVVLKIKEILPEIQSEYEIIDVVAKQYCGYYYLKTKKPVIPAEGDIFFSAEATEGVVSTNGKYFELLRNCGCKTFFFLHDLIPVKFPEYMGSSNFVKFYRKYLSVLAFATGVICNSKSVLDDFEAYLSAEKIRGNPSQKRTFTHLGVDFKMSPDGEPEIKNPENPVFLMVSTVEARKKYDQAVMAFDILWKKGFDVKLCIVGKYGWNAEKARKLIEENPELNRRLFWYKSGISDDELSELYKKSDAVIFASMAEGFGLSLIEAACYKKPLIIRDIPIFKEIVGSNAFYFEGESPEILAVTVQEWLMLYKDGRVPSSENIRYISWEECASNVFVFLKG